MATRTLVKLLDDLDGSEATETIKFGLDGTDYEIDLNDTNAGKLRSALQRYAGSARRIGRASNHRGGVAYHQPHASKHNAEVRAWALANGLPVAEKGRIAQQIIDQYNASKNKPVKSTETPVLAAPVPEVAKPAFVEPTATTEAPTAEKPKSAPRKRAVRKAATKKAAASAS
jgi:hypothetical protein